MKQRKLAFNSFWSHALFDTARGLSETQLDHFICLLNIIKIIGPHHTIMHTKDFVYHRFENIEKDKVKEVTRILDFLDIKYTDSEVTSKLKADYETFQR